MGRMPLRGVIEEPQGFAYGDGLIGEAEEERLLRFARGLDLRPVVVGGRPSGHLVCHFGRGCDHDTWRPLEYEPMPAELEELRRRAESFAGVRPGAFVEALVTCCPAGAGVGWHRDGGAFGEHVAGVPFGATARLQLRRGPADDRRVYEQELRPRSAYVLRGPARFVWQHRVPPAGEDRYSVTFRALRTAR